MAGRHFCVSFADPRDIEDCVEVGQSVMLDNGAFSAFTKGKEMDVKGFADFCDKYLAAPHWAVIPDVIGGSEDQQRTSLSRWNFPDHLSAPVWHLHLSLDYLLELADHFPKICLGSSGDFWQIGTRKWEQRMDETFEALCRSRRHLPWIHGMRMLGQAGNRWPLASADSTNIARNHLGRKFDPEERANKLDAVQTPIRYKSSSQMELLS